MKARPSAILIVLAMLAPLARAENTPATQPQRDWGETKAGLRVSLDLAGPLQAGGSFSIRPALGNAGRGGAPLGPRKEAFGWLFLVSNAYGSKRAYFSEKFALPPKTVWLQTLPGGKILSLGTIDVTKLKLFEYRRGLKVVDAYPVAPEGEKLTPAGTMAAKIAPGVLGARLMFAVWPPSRDEPMLLVSNTVSLPVEPPAWKKLSEKEQAAFVHDLLQRFDNNAWSAKQAHDVAVKLGRPILPELIAAAKQTRRPSHSRLWLATTLADIRDPNAAAALQDLLQDGLSGVRAVVAYHGPKQKNKKLDAAIVARYGKPDAPTREQAFALLGFLVFRKTVPAKLIEAGLASDDPRSRATAAKALTKLASEFNVARLVKLLEDPDAQVRSAAAKVLAAMGVKNRTVYAALVNALEDSPDATRKVLCDALSELTGKDIRYDPGADKKTRQAAVRRWQAWLASGGK
ncbi:MAG: HEAT repeat domain-containing protein [Phycisphaerae bacterium]